MKTRPELKRQETEPAALKALRRAAKNAVELAQLTGTPAYVLENGRIIDIAKRTRRKRRNHGHS